MVCLRRITEGKQVGTIYHVCSISATLYNLSNNVITPGSESNYIKGKGSGVSFTRDKSYIVDTVDRKPFLFQFVLDGDSLSNSKKIEPYSAPDYDGSEKEEMVFGEIKNLKSYLLGVNVIINVKILSSITGVFSPSFLEALELVQKSGVKSTIIVTNSYNPFSKVRTNIPKDLPSLIEMYKKVRDYDSQSMAVAIHNLLQKFFNKADVKELKKGEFLVDPKSMPLADYSREISALVETIQEELGSDSIIITEDKYNKEVVKRHGENKLSYLMNSRYYKLHTIILSVMFDWVYSTSPYVKLNVTSNTKSQSVKSYYIYFI